MVDKTTPRLGLPVPYLTNPLKIDVGKLTDALTMLDKNAVMLTDWDITSDSWQKMGKISNLAQGKIAITLMVVTGTGFANIVMQTGDGSVTTVGDPARITVTAQTNLGANSATILGGKLVEVAADTYEIWFNIAPSTAPRKWTGLLIAGNGATIDWTHSSGAQPTGGVALNIARSLTDQEIASPTITSDGAVLTAAYAGLMGIKLPYFDFAATGDTITSHVWRVGETMRVKASDAISSNGFPSGVTGAGAVAWRIHCESVNEDRTSMVLIFASEGATPTWLYRITRTNNVWSAPRRMYASDNPPAASEVKAIAQLDVITTVINLNDRILPAHYGVVSLTSVAGAVAANNFPFDETGQLIVFPIGVSGGITQIYIAKSGRIASRSYDGSVFTDWRKSAKSGVNDDITSMTGLSGPLKLGGDAAGDYDAVTLRQLKANSGGSGPTMNGVLNNFIGAVEWFNGSRAKLPPGYVAADGQTLQRSAYPDLWAAISSNFLNSVTEAQWNTQSSNARGSFYYNRGSYSLGDGSTTFRVPDLNGGQTGSITNTFLNGSAPSLSANVGQVRESAAPAITGGFAVPVPVGHAGYAKGAFAGSNGDSVTQPGVPAAIYSAADGLASGATRLTDSGKYGFQLDASRSDKLYTGSAGELRPNTAVGIWIIRVSGAFQSASTNFSVIAGDTTLPGNNTDIRGGAIRSVYQVAGADHMSVEVRAQGTVGGVYTPVIEMVSPSGGSPVTRTWSLPAASGELALSSDSRFNKLDGKTGGVITGDVTHRGGTYWMQGNSFVAQSAQKGDGTWPTVSPAHSCLLTNRVPNAGQPGGWFGMNISENVGVDCFGTLYLDAAGVNRRWLFNQAGNAIAANGSWINNSDIRIKTDINRVDDPLGKMRMIRGVTWSRLDGSVPGQGFIAQEVQKAFPNAVFSGGDTELADGSIVKDTLAVDVSGVAAALHHEAILALLARIEVLETKLKDK